MSGLCSNAVYGAGLELCYLARAGFRVPLRFLRSFPLPMNAKLILEFVVLLGASLMGAPTGVVGLGP